MYLTVCHALIQMYLIQINNCLDLKLGHYFHGYDARSGTFTEKCLEVTVTKFSLVPNMAADEGVAINSTLCLNFHFIIHPGWGQNTLQYIEGNFMINISCGEWFEGRKVFVRFTKVGIKSFGVGIGLPSISEKVHLTPLLLFIKEECTKIYSGWILAETLCFSKRPALVVPYTRFILCNKLCFAKALIFCFSNAHVYLLYD